MKRIAIIGSGGVGKTYLSNHLSAKTNIPVFHLDLITYGSNWKKNEDSAVLDAHAKIIEKDSWVIDGMMTRTLLERMKRSDTVIFLDYSPWRSIYGAFKRLFLDYGKVRKDTPKGCTESFDYDFFLYLLSFRKNVRPNIYKILEKSPDKCSIMVFKHPNETQKWLDSYEPH